MFASRRLAVLVTTRGQRTSHRRHTYGTHNPMYVLIIGCVIGVMVLMHNFPHMLPKSPRPQPRPGSAPAWMKAHKRLVAEVQTACDRHVPEYDILWYGDSITESMREEYLGQPCTMRCQGIAAIVDRHYKDFRFAGFGLSGDTSDNLLWRLSNGESPSCPGVQTLVVLIGTNDLGTAAQDAGPSAAAIAVRNAEIKTVAGVQEVCRALHLLAPAAHIVLLGILPRGLKDTSNQSSYIIYHDQPSMFTHPINRINQQLSAFAASQERLRFADCGGVFLLPGGDLDPELMPDALHPSAKGMEQMLSCVDPVVRGALHSV